MLDPRFKNICLGLHSFVVNKVFLYDRKSLYHMLLKFYHHLDAFAKNGNDFTNKGIDEDCNLNIFEMIASISQLAKELINKKLLI